MSDALLEDLYRLLRFFLSKSSRLPEGSLDKPEVVYLFFELLAVNAQLQIDFLQKADSRAIAALIDQDIILEEALIFLLQVSKRRKKWFINIVSELNSDGIWWVLEALESEQLLDLFNKEDLVFHKRHKEGIELLAGISVDRMRQHFQKQLFDVSIGLDVFMKTHLQWRLVDDGANDHIMFLFKRHEQMQIIESIQSSQEWLFLIKRLILVFYPKGLPDSFDVLKKGLIQPFKHYLLKQKKPSELKRIVVALPAFLIEAVLEAGISGNIQLLSKSFIETMAAEFPNVKKIVRRKKWGLVLPKPVELPEILKHKLEILKIELGVI